GSAKPPPRPARFDGSPPGQKQPPPPPPPTHPGTPVPQTHAGAEPLQSRHSRAPLAPPEPSLDVGKPHRQLHHPALRHLRRPGRIPHPPDIQQDVAQGVRVKRQNARSPREPPDRLDGEALRNRADIAELLRDDQL